MDFTSANNVNISRQGLIILISLFFLSLQDQRSLKVGEISQQESQNMTATSMTMQTEAFSSEKVNLGFFFFIILSVTDSRSLYRLLGGHFACKVIIMKFIFLGETKVPNPPSYGPVTNFFHR